MKILKHGDECVIKIIKKKHLDGDAGYKVSQFVYQFSEGGRYLLRNTVKKYSDKGNSRTYTKRMESV